MTRSLFLLWIAPFALYAQPYLGVFDGQTDIGTILHTGSAVAGRFGSYTVTASGDNMWAAEDDFHFVWKKVNADWVGLSADISIVTPADKAIKILANFTGGAGSFHSAAWSPDSKSIAVLTCGRWIAYYDAPEDIAKLLTP